MYPSFNQLTELTHLGSEVRVALQHRMEFMEYSPIQLVWAVWLGEWHSVLMAIPGIPLDARNIIPATWLLWPACKSHGSSPSVLSSSQSLLSSNLLFSSSFRSSRQYRRDMAMTIWLAEWQLRGSHLTHECTKYQLAEISRPYALVMKSMC